jgi:hypothetical protein
MVMILRKRDAKTHFVPNSLLKVQSKQQGLASFNHAAIPCACAIHPYRAAQTARKCVDEKKQLT